LYEKAAAAAVASEVSNVVGRSLLRDATEKILLANAAAGGSSAEPGGDGVRFMLLVLTPDGKSLMEETDTGAPLLLRSVAPMLDVELALGALSRAGRRHLGPVGAASVQAENTDKQVVSGIAANLVLSPIKSKVEQII